MIIAIPRPKPPVCKLIAPSFAGVGDMVTIDASNSTGDIKNYRFELEYGVTAWGPGPLYAVHRYQKPGTYIISCVLIGPTGLVTEASHTLTVR
jgi:hypothetical protein